jgi:hypothetical protein
METPSPHLLLRVPSPTQRSLTFCEPNPRELKRWIAGLPKANLGEMARLLYQSLVELNRLITPTENRLHMLELLRPEVYFVCQNLERHFLNQSIVLDERPRKVANLCQALQRHLAGGYKLIIARIAGQNDAQRDSMLAVAMQRAAHCLYGPLVRASQLYCPVPEGLWLELHQLYQLASSRGLQQMVVRDRLALHTEGLSIEHTYLLALLLGCARCNQMRQNNIASLAKSLEAWSPLVTLQAAELPSSLFAVAPQQDAAPRYTSLFSEAERPTLLGINPRQLVDAINHYLRLPEPERAQSRFPLAEGMSLDLLQHLSCAWGDISERTFQRIPGQGNLTLCIGMSALHFFLANQRPFAEFLKIATHVSAAVFKPDPGAPDVWANAFDAQKTNDWENGLPFEKIEYSLPNASTEQAEPSSAESYLTFELPIINHSPGGYCLAWPKEVSSQLQAGELLGIQDAPGQGWSVALVRWIRQVKGGGTQMGIELIAPHAQPCGLQLVRKTEQSSQYLRALLLPAISAISRPASLITPTLPFREGNKVSINLSGHMHRAVLSHRQTSTGSFNQFEYRNVDESAATAPVQPVTAPANRRPRGDEDFDSLWKSL